MKNSDSPTWSELVFTSEFMATISKLAIRRFGQGSLAEEASTYVVEYLSLDDWEKCRSFEGKAQPTTFLYSLSTSALEEFSRKRFGRPRPPAWLQELGDMWMKLWRSLCLERQPLPALVDRYSTRGFREPAAVEQAARVIKARIPTCGQSIRDTELADDIERLSDAHEAASGQCRSKDPEFENPFYGELLMMINTVCDSDVSHEDFRQSAASRFDNMAAAQQRKLDTLRSALELTDQEKIMLRLIYLEGLSKSAASKALGLPAHQAGRTVNEALERISAALAKCDISLDDLVEPASTFVSRSAVPSL
ncbi:hypothetical protein [Allohahella marinimesophila]|uniref:RNA polymerase sigma factor (Sigma-70 family) n=1 Tax=Allohahella marinimesophila TaxID=1054972 RepID=A0ABP7PH47_9GAMM